MKISTFINKGLNFVKKALPSKNPFQDPSITDSFSPSQPTISAPRNWLQGLARATAFGCLLCAGLGLAAPALAQEAEPAEATVLTEPSVSVESVTEQNTPPAPDPGLEPPDPAPETPATPTSGNETTPDLVPNLFPEQDRAAATEAVPEIVFDGTVNYQGDGPSDEIRIQQGDQQLNLSCAHETWNHNVDLGIIAFRDAGSDPDQQSEDCLEAGELAANVSEAMYLTQLAERTDNPELAEAIQYEAALAVVARTEGEAASREIRQARIDRLLAELNLPEEVKRERANQFRPDHYQAIQAELTRQESLPEAQQDADLIYWLEVGQRRQEAAPGFAEWQATQNEPEPEPEPLSIEASCSVAQQSSSFAVGLPVGIVSGARIAISQSGTDVENLSPGCESVLETASRVAEDQAVLGAFQDEEGQTAAANAMVENRVEDSSLGGDDTFFNERVQARLDFQEQSGPRDGLEQYRRLAESMRRARQQ